MVVSSPDDLSALPTAEAVLGRAAEENFPVASLLLPPATRRHLFAVYGYARLVDDTGDESAGDRAALLDRLEADVDRLYRDDEPEHPLVSGLAPTVEACRIPSQPLRALIEANRREQGQVAYETYDDLLAYCALSANPVGHVVLHVFGAVSPARLRLSDAICSGLQLAEHWQDVAEDLARGRIYIPREDLRLFGCTAYDLAAPHANRRVRALMAFEVARAHRLLDRGAPLIRTLRGPAALAAAAFVAGGRAALAAIERCDHDVLAGTPRATPMMRLSALAATLAKARRRDVR